MNADLLLGFAFGVPAGWLAYGVYARWYFKRALAKRLASAMNAAIIKRAP